VGRGAPLPTPHTPRRLRRLDPRAVGARPRRLRRLVAPAPRGPQMKFLDPPLNRLELCGFVSLAFWLTVTWFLSRTQHSHVPLYQNPYSRGIMSCDSCAFSITPTIQTNLIIGVGQMSVHDVVKKSRSI